MHREVFSVTAVQDRVSQERTPPRPATAEVGFTGVMGVAAEDTHPALQTDAFKELINKLAWVLGSTYRVPYTNSKTCARTYALRMARKVLADHGYPTKIAKSTE